MGRERDKGEEGLGEGGGERREIETNQQRK